MKVQKSLILAAAVAAAIAAPSAFATNGYFQHGYGVKSQGMAGVGVALPQDAMAAAANPAGMVMVGNRVDLGISRFNPDRATSISPPNGTATDYDPNLDSGFWVPDFGYNKMLDSTRSIGIAVYGNGGMNTSYNKPVSLFGSTNAGVDLSQLFIAPTMAWKLSDKNAVGVSLVYAYQRFKAEGLQNFDSTTQTSHTGKVTNNGHDSSTGFGLRFGWTGQISQNLTMGATYASKMSMSKFKKYEGLFAEDGKFDIPSNYAVGLAYTATPKTVVAFDIEKIKYSDSKAVHNPLGPVSGGGQLLNTLGTSGGAGFGWEDMTVYKLGVAHEYSPTLTLRAGWNHGKQPIPAQETFFNLLAPGVVEDHLTLGFTWKMEKNFEISGNYFHAFSKEVKGSGSIPTAFAGGGSGPGEANLRMEQNGIGVSFAWKM